MKPLVLALPGNEALASAISESLGGETGAVSVRRFPDDETYLRVDATVAAREVILAATLDRPNQKLVDLYLLASNVRAGGASRIILAAPYLPYMRQDRIFNAGEGISAAHIGRWLSSFVDALVTMDPHLHRIHALSEVYSIPTRVVHGAPAIGRWIRENVFQPILIGPDEESGAWVSEAAQTAGCRYLILKKMRHGDREVSIAVPGVHAYMDYTPVLVDDIVSSGATMLETARRLHALGMASPVCVAVHALFAGEAYAQLKEVSERIVSCNTVTHPSNAIDVHRDIAMAVTSLAQASPPAVAA